MKDILNKPKKHWKKLAGKMVLKGKKMLRSKIQILLLTGLLFCSCKNKESSVFYGKYFFEDSKLSNSLILDFNNKTVSSPTIETDLSLYHLTDSTLIRGNEVYNFQLKGEILRTFEDDKVVHVFERAVANTEHINSIKELSTILRGRVWEDLSKTSAPDESLKKVVLYKFEDSIINRKVNYYLNDKLVYDELEALHYKISQYEDNYFVLLKGKYPESPYNVLLELRDISPHKLIFSGIKEFKNFELNRTGRKFKIKGAKRFQVCNEDILGQYYYNGMGSHFKGGLNEVKQIFSQKVKTINKESDTGYVRIRFLINCEGETGRFSILEVDKDYEPKSFSHELVAQLFKITTTLSDWELEELPQTGKTYDNYRHLTFKIRNGKVLDILP
jgi:hypothetical protein